MKKTILFFFIVNMFIYAGAQMLDFPLVENDTISVATMSSDPNEFSLQLPRYTNYSPEAQQFLRYGQIPVDYSTGVPQIEVPIYNIKLGTFNLPISISYHASGIKVQDIASVVGLGWTLNAGGMIVQTVYDHPGDFQRGYKPLYKSADEARAAMDIDRQKRNQINTFWGDLQNDPSAFGHSLISSRFNYSFNNNNGVFRYNFNTSNYEMIPHSPVKLDMSQYGSGIITITETNGDKYFFKRYQTIQNTKSTAWPSYDYYLDKIILAASQDVIQFIYTSGKHYVVSKPIEYFYGGWDVRFSPNAIHQECQVNGYQILRRDFMMSEYEVNPVLISKIQWKNAMIEFDYKRDRKEGMVDRLDNIVIKEGTKIIKRIEFANKDRYLETPYNKGRMILEGLKNGNENYSFRYNGTIVNYPTQPGLGSYIYSKYCYEDFWGYYNGSSNIKWIPFEWEYENFGLNRLNRRYISHREPNPQYTQLGILKEITYPTGGKSVFEYEQNIGKHVYENYFRNNEIVGLSSNNNELNYFGGVRIKNITNYDENKCIEKKTYTYEGGPTSTIYLQHFVENRKKIFMPPYLPERPSGGWGSGPGSLYNYTFLSDYYITNGDPPYELSSQVAYSETKYPIGDPSSQSVFYNVVTEYQGDVNENTGKKEFNYIGDQFENGSHWSPEAFKWHERGTRKALIKSIKDYKNENGNYILVKELTNNYKLAGNDGNVHVTGVLFDYNYDYNMYNALYTGFEYEIHPYYYGGLEFNNIRIVKPYYILEESLSKEHTENGIISSSTKYKYDTSYRVFSPIEVETTNSNGNTTIIKYSFPFNYNNVVPYNWMVQDHIISPVIKKTRYINEVEDISMENQYEKKNNLYVHNSVLLGDNNNLELRVRYINYDIYGNPIQISKDEVPFFYLWSYMGQYPIAEITNANYEDIEAGVKYAFGVNSINDLSQLTTITINQLENFRSYGSLSEALINTYTHQPLVGLLTSTDPRGITNYYVYDDFGRLVEIYYQENGVKRILESYKYNYKQ